MAALVGGHRQFPQLNTHNYLEILTALSKESKFIGAGVAINTVPLVSIRKGLQRVIPENNFSQLVGRTIIDSFKDEAAITPLENKPGSQLYVAIVQLLLSVGHPYWKGGLAQDVKSAIVRTAEEKGIPLPDDLTHVFGYASMPEIRGHRAPIIAVTLFPCTEPDPFYEHASEEV